MSDPTPTPAGQVATGADVRLRAGGVVTSAPGSAVVAIQTDQGIVSVDPLVTLLVIDVPLPQTLGSVVLASVNGGPDEPIVLVTGSGGNPRWLQSSTRTLLTGADSIVARRLLYQAPTVPVLRP